MYLAYGMQILNRTMKILFISLLLLTSASVFAALPCKKCDLEKIKKVNANLDKLTFQLISDFLCTFDSSCSNNAEYSEWSNETLFKVLEKSPSLFFKVIAKGNLNAKLLINEIQNPVNDFALNAIYKKVKATVAPANIKSKYMQALIIASEKGNIKIERRL